MSDTLAIIDYGSGNLRSAAKSFEKVIADEDLKIEVKVTSHAEDLHTASHIVLPGQGAFGDCMQGLRAVDGMIEALEEAVLKRGAPFFGICVGMQLLADKGYEYGEHEGLGWIPGEVVALQPNDPNLKIPHMGWNTVELTGAPHSFLQQIKRIASNTPSEAKGRARARPADSSAKASPATEGRLSENREADKNRAKRQGRDCGPAGVRRSIPEATHSRCSDSSQSKQSEALLCGEGSSRHSDETNKITQRSTSSENHYYFVHSFQGKMENKDHVLGTADYGGPVTAIIGRDNIIGTQFHPEKSQSAGLDLLTDFLMWKP